MNYSENIQLSPALAEVEINYKSKVKPSEMAQVKNSKDVSDIFRSVWSGKLEYIEEMVLLLLNKNNKVLGWAKISSGGIAGTVCDPKVIFQIALNCNASKVVLCHNHPSSSLIPSEEDKKLTKRIAEGGKLLDIEVIDHVILTADGYMSFADEGLL